MYANLVHLCAFNTLKINLKAVTKIKPVRLKINRTIKMKLNKS